MLWRHWLVSYVTGVVDVLFVGTAGFEKIDDTIVQFDTMHAAGFRFLL